MKVLVIAGYGDAHRYIDLITRNWYRRFGLEPEVYIFGWNGKGDTFYKKWEAFETKLRQFDNVSIIGISAGASVALRALKEHPKIVSSVVSICGPSSSRYLIPEVLNKHFPVLEKSLASFSVKDLPPKKILTLRALYDKFVPPKTVVIPGAKNKRMLTVFHAPSIFWGLFGRGRTIARFVKSQGR